jgi:Predicted membrane protein
MASLNSRTICALTLSFIAFTDISVILDIPVLRQVLGFVLLTFLPGLLLIQILKLTKNRLEKLLFLIGLSICFLMFVPLAMNFAYPALGISRPISLPPLTITLSLILAALSFVSYWKRAVQQECRDRYRMPSSA